MSTSLFAKYKLKLTGSFAGVTHATEKTVWGFNNAFMKFTYRQGNIKEMKPHYSQVETNVLDRLTAAPLWIRKQLACILVHSHQR